MTDALGLMTGDFGQSWSVESKVLSGVSMNIVSKGNEFITWDY